MKMERDPVRDALLGFAIGDALGVPVEYEKREWLKQNPVRRMLGHIRHNQPEGTWSDDSSLVFCTVESLCQGYNLEDIAIHFSRWKNDKFWTPRGRVFDIGIQTSKAIQRIDRCIELDLRIKPIPAESVNEFENGNGSLMRILPLAFYLKDKPVSEQFPVIRDVSALTHPHIRAVIGCFIYVRFAISLLKGNDKNKAYLEIQQAVPGFLEGKAHPAEIRQYSRILQHDISKLPESSIKSTSYVLHSLEACLWSVMRNVNFRDTVLAAVNLGDDADTIAALAGGLAGIIYGPRQFPEDWLNILARKDDIIELAGRFAKTLPS